MMSLIVCTAHTGIDIRVEILIGTFSNGKTHQKQTALRFINAFIPLEQLFDSSPDFPTLRSRPNINKFTEYVFVTEFIRIKGSGRVWVIKV